MPLDPGYNAFQFGQGQTPPKRPNLQGLAPAPTPTPLHLQRPGGTFPVPSPRPPNALQRAGSLKRARQVPDAARFGNIFHTEDPNLFHWNREPMSPEERIGKKRYQARMGRIRSDGHEPFVDQERYSEVVRRPGSMTGVPEKLDEARTLAPAFTEEYYRSNPHRRNSPVKDDWHINEDGYYTKEPRRVYSPEERRRLMQREAQFGRNNPLKSLEVEQAILDGRDNI